MKESLTKIKRQSLGEVVDVKALLSEGSESAEAGMKLAREADRFGLSIRDYLTLAVKPEADGLTGYEQALLELNLPFRNDFKNGVVLAAAADTFATYAGTRAMFPEVVDDMLRWAFRQDQFESVAPMLAGSRTIVGTEVISTVVNDDSASQKSFSVTEFGQIPVQSIRTTQNTVAMFKHGSAIRTSYEFQRRASLDILTPYLARIGRELERSKVKEATTLLINGDGVQGAAGVINQSSYNSAVGVNSTNGVISWEHVLYWLVQRAKAGVPVDTIAMNWDGWFKWNMLFAKPNVAGGPTPMEQMAKAGVQVAQQAVAMNLRVTPVLSSTVPAGQLVGFSKMDTLEELKEAGSDIQETERNVRNQSITIFKTEVTGYRLPYGDTRSIFNFNA